jgi:hypothetical protein
MIGFGALVVARLRVVKIHFVPRALTEFANLSATSRGFENI